MIKYKKDLGRDLNFIENAFTDRLAQKNWACIQTVINVVREPVLILDKDLRVMTANESFYRVFQVEQKDTEQALVYELGNGQWNIPALRELLEKILPQNSFFKDFDVTHTFPVIGRKSMILNAREIHSSDYIASVLFPSFILLAVEDNTPMLALAETAIAQVKKLASQSAERIVALETRIAELKKIAKKAKS